MLSSIGARRSSGYPDGEEVKEGCCNIGAKEVGGVGLDRMERSLGTSFRPPPSLPSLDLDSPPRISVLSADPILSRSRLVPPPPADEAVGALAALLELNPPFS